MMRVQAAVTLAGIVGFLAGQQPVLSADPERPATDVHRASVDSQHPARMNLLIDADSDGLSPRHLSPFDDEHRQAEKQARYREIRERLETFLRHLESSSRSPQIDRQNGQPTETQPEGDRPETAVGEQHSPENPPEGPSKSDQTAADSRPAAPSLSTADRSTAAPSTEQSASGASAPPAPAHQEPPRTTPSSLQDTRISADTPQHRPASSGSAPDLSVAGVSVVDGPVDRVALGDNLFAIQEYRLALESYLQVDVGKLPRDHRFWVQYQVAACHRHLNDLPAARKQLRILAGQEEAGWLGRAARWWLDTLRDRAELEQQLAALQEQIQQRKERSDAP